MCDAYQKKLPELEVQKYQLCHTNKITKKCGFVILCFLLKTLIHGGWLKVWNSAQNHGKYDVLYMQRTILSSAFHLHKNIYDCFHSMKIMNENAARQCHW